MATGLTFSAIVLLGFLGLIGLIAAAAVAAFAMRSRSEDDR